MTTNGVCKWCGKEIVRRGKKAPVFCSNRCKGEWQKTQKPVDEAWLRQKYLDEGLGTYQIGKLVNRNPKQVYAWLKGYGIPIREREWDTEPDPANKPYQDPAWLRAEYIDKQRSAGDIASDFGITGEVVLFHLRRAGIPARMMSETRAMKYWGQSGEANAMYGKSGKGNPNWRGGVTPERQALYSSLEWADAAKIVWRRDGGTCQRCGAGSRPGYPLHIHHIVSFAVKELRAEPSNLVLLCIPCHHFVHSRANVNHEFIKEGGA